MKTLIVYYSYGGNTRRIARMLQEQLGADMAEIATVQHYTGSYDAVVNQDRLGHGALLHGEDRAAKVQSRLGHDGFLLIVGNTCNFSCKEIYHYSEFSTNQQI